MDAGNWLEPALAKWYAHETGYDIASFGSVVHPKYPFMGCTPDLCIFGVRRLAQIKLVGTWMAHHWEDDVPEYVQIQIQHELEVCDADVCDVVALIGGTDFRILPIERDRELGGYLVQICHDFYRDYMFTREMPPVDASGHAEAALKARYARDKTGIIAATPETDRLARAWLAADEKLGEAETERKLYTNQLKQIMGDARGINGDFYRVNWKTTASGSRPFTVKQIALKKSRAA
jgi:predicted phage-related endonuclease